MCTWDNLALPFFSTDLSRGSPKERLKPWSCHSRNATGEPTIHLPGCECGVFALLQHHRGLEYPPPLGSCFHVLPLLSTLSFHLAGCVAECPTTVPGLLASLSVWLPVDIRWCILIKELQAPTAGTNLSFSRLFSLCNRWGCFLYYSN